VSAGGEEGRMSAGGEEAPMSPGGDEARMSAGGDDAGGHGAGRGEGSGQLRAQLQPLGPHERPPALLVATAVAALLSVGVVVGALSVHDLASHGGSLPGGLFLAVVLALLAQGMYRRRYWAVLGFEALLAFQIIVTSLALVVASTLTAAGGCLLAIVLGGWLFWKLIRVMGRIQAGEHQGRR
jgi:hypothetical protein